jgi:very-short-patch-repair endonuclease
MRNFTKKKEITPYDLKLKSNARKNRKEMNAPEANLWYKVLRNKKLLNYKFLKQKPILNYILDFYCSKLLLGIEIDGESHNEQMNYDKQRSESINKIGIKIIRYSNYEVMNNLDGVYFNLIKQIKIREKEIK